MSNWVGIWFQWVHDWGYPGIVILMAMESSIVPIPSEVVIPPAAYWAAQGRYSFPANRLEPGHAGRPCNKRPCEKHGFRRASHILKLTNLQ